MHGLANEQSERMDLIRVLSDTGKMWINPRAWNEIEAQRKAKEEAEASGVEAQEGGFFGFERENAEFNEQIARSDVQRGVFVADEETASVLAKHGNISRQEWIASGREASTPRVMGDGLGPSGSSFSTPTSSEVELARKAEEFIKRHGDGSSSASLLSKILGNALGRNGSES